MFSRLEQLENRLRRGTFSFLEMLFHRNVLFLRDGPAHRPRLPLLQIRNLSFARSCHFPVQIDVRVDSHRQLLFPRRVEFPGQRLVGLADLFDGARFEGFPEALHVHHSLGFQVRGDVFGPGEVFDWPPSWLRIFVEYFASGLLERENVQFAYFAFELSVLNMKRIRPFWKSKGTRSYLRRSGRVRWARRESGPWCSGSSGWCRTACSSLCHSAGRTCSYFCLKLGMPSQTQRNSKPK